MCPIFGCIGKTSSALGVKAKINSVDVATANSGLIVGLEVSGNFQEIYKFLTLLENSPYEIDFFHGCTCAWDGRKCQSFQNPDWEAIFRIQLLALPNNFMAMKIDFLKRK